MPVAEKQYQSTTVRLPKHVYDRAKKVLVRAQASSFNEFVVQAIEEKMRRLSEAEIDAAFAQMAHDTDYQRNAIALTGQFEKSDWEAYTSAGTHEHTNARTSARPSKTRSR